MKRRDFSRTLSLGASWLGLGGVSLAGSQAIAQPFVPSEGKDYAVLAQPVRQNAPAKKIEVIEFFWYGCPHCYAFEPFLEAWVQKLPADVVFHRVPWAIRPIPGQAHQRLFYALQTLGVLEAVHRKVFDAFHNRVLHPEMEDAPEVFADFLAKNGVDRAKFLDAYNSFTVRQVKVNEATRLADDYRVSGVPTLAVGGRFFTLPGNPQPMLDTANYLIAKARKKA